MTIVLLMSKIVCPNGSTQHLCKLLPTPKDLILRRFYPLKKLRNGLKTDMNCVFSIIIQSLKFRYYQAVS